MGFSSEILIGYTINFDIYKKEKRKKKGKNLIFLYFNIFKIFISEIVIFLLDSVGSPL